MRYVKIPGQNIHRRKSLRLLKKYRPILFITSVVLLLAILIVFLSGTGSVFRYVFLNLTPFKSTDGRVNVLLLGNAGGAFDGPYLTDTMLVASYNLKTNQAYFISLPRDLWLDRYKIKLNVVYELGQSQGEGLEFTKGVVSDILGIPIHYALRLDFRGFIKAVDEVGGLDMVIGRSFDDYYYPIAGRENDLCGANEEEREFSKEEAKKLNIEPGKRKVLITPDGKIATDSADPQRGLEYFRCRYEQISFLAGPTHMDGKTTLKFVRSRMGTNNEGSDFARSKRQQKVIEAFRKKVLSLETLINLSKVKSIINTFGQSIETDIPVDDIVELYGFSKKAQKTLSFVLGDGQENLFFNPPSSDYGGAWVLVPKDRSLKEIHQYVKRILSGEVKSEGSPAAWSSNR